MQKYTLTRPQSAAAIIVALGKSRSSQLLKGFKSDELRVIMDSAQSLGSSITRDNLEQILDSFEAEFINGVGLIDSSDEFDSILSEALGDDELVRLKGRYQAAQSNDTPQPIDVWQEIEKLPNDELAAFCESETAQLSAVIIDRLSSEKAASVIEALSQERRLATLQRLYGFKKISDQMLKSIEDMLKERFAFGKEADGGNAKVEKLASIINEMEAESGSRLLDELSSKLEEKQVAALRKLLFRFEDIGSLKQEALTVVFDGMSADLMASALEGCSEETVEAVLGAVSARTRRMVEGELNSGVKRPQKQITDARKSICQLVLKMINENKIER